LQLEEVIFQAPIGDIWSEARVPLKDSVQLPPEAEDAADIGWPDTIMPVITTAIIPSPRNSLRSLGFNFFQGHRQPHPIYEF
jgi:hypothetical protein